MSERELEDLEAEIEEEMRFLEELQQQHIRETGSRFVAPARLNWTEKRGKL